MSGVRLAARAAAGVTLAAALAAAATGATAQAGRYRLAGSARVQARSVLDRNVEVDAVADLATAGKGGAGWLRLESDGYRCDLAVRATAGGVLALDPGQRCTVRLDRSTVRGNVEARLTAGRGRVDGKRLALETSWELSGALRLRLGGEKLEVMGREVEVPAAWGPEVPVRGTAVAHAEGPTLEPRAPAR